MAGAMQNALKQNQHNNMILRNDIGSGCNVDVPGETVMIVSSMSIWLFKEQVGKGLCILLKD